MNRRKEFFEYLRTFFLTVLFAFVSVIILLAVIQHQIYEEQAQRQQQAQDETVDYYLIGVLIEKNKYLEEQYPKDYKINLKLGILYEIKKDYKNSEIEYQKAIAKAPYDEFKPKYKLALLYLTTSRLDDAQAVIDSIKEEPSKRLIEYKADIYEKLGDKYYNSGDYENAIEKYEKSLIYWEAIKKKKEIEYIKNSLASSYVYLADTYLNNMRPNDAVDSLKMAMTIVDAPILKYKLALLLMKDNPDLAYQYFEEVFNEAPEIINYESYYNFLSTMAENADAQGDIAQAELYKYKAKKLKEYFTTNVLSVDDLVLEEVRGEIKSNNLLKKDTIYLEAEVKNISKYNIDSLYLEIIFKDNNEIIGDYFKQVVDKKSVLKVGSYTPLISIRISEPQRTKDNRPRNITAEIYASKTEKSYKILLKTVNIQEQVKKKKPNKFIKALGLFLQKITSKLPSFLF